MDDPTVPKDEVRQLEVLWEKRIAEGNQRMDRMPVHERPREKLLAKGPFALSDLELMAVMIGTGTPSSEVFSLAASILKALDQIDWQPEIKSLLKIAGVGPTKAALIVAAIELSRRHIHPRGLKISSTIDVLPFVRHLGTYKQEHFVCISLNGANEVLAIRTVTIGTVDSVLTHAREVFADPITDRATAVILAHNHPSGDVTPSKDDRKVTRYLNVAGKFLGIQLLDHIIFSHKDHYSFLESGELPGPSSHWAH